MAIGGMVVFLLALLASVGLVRIALVVVALAGVGAALALLLLLLGGSSARIGELSRAAVRRTRSVGSSVVGGASRGASQLARSGSHAAVATRDGVQARVPEVRDRYARSRAAAGRGLAAATAQTQRRARSATSQLPAVRDRYVRAQSAAGRQLSAASKQTQRQARGATSQLPSLRDHYARFQAAAARRLTAATTETRRRVQAAATATSGRAEHVPPQPPAAPEREALRANAAGAQLRREGAYLQAAAHHQVALAIYRELGDRRSEALTLNNLALALDRTGDPGAIDLFEQAAATLGELGEAQQEGEVIANLALAFRRRGRQEQSTEVLEIALEKLNPESLAYQKVESLRRAS